MGARALQVREAPNGCVERPEAGAPAHAGKARRRNANHGVPLPIQLDRTAGRGLARAVTLAPVRVADDDRPVAACRTILGVEEKTSALRLHTEDREIPRAYRLAEHSLRALVRADGEGVGDVQGGVAERPLRCEERLVLGVRPDHVDLAGAVLHGHPEEHRHEAIGLAERKRPEERRVDDAEDRGGRPDAYGENEDRDDRESGIRPEHAPSVSDVVAQVVEECGAGRSHVRLAVGWVSGATVENWPWFERGTSDTAAPSLSLGMTRVAGGGRLVPPLMRA